MPERRAPRDESLRQGLRGWMIFFIIISTVIGAGIFSNGGTAMGVAGPAGVLVALLVMSIIAICVSECISELAQLFPVPNAIVEYIRKFIDEDFGWAIGIAYWLTYASIFAAQNMAASHLSEYWGGPSRQNYRTAVFYVASPIAMLVINTAGVHWFGWIEAFGGALKMLLVAGTTLVLWIMAGTKRNNELQAGFRHNPEFAKSDIAAVCSVIPIVAFGFIGLEAISVTAFEAAPKSLAWPSRFVAYIASTMYLLCLLSQCLNIPWNNPDLPEIYGGIGKIQKRGDDGGLDASFSNILAIMAIRKWGKNNLDGFVNGAIIFSVLSASNTALYISSRTLYGMALRIQDSSVLGKAAKAFKKVDHKTGVPLRALLLSWVFFIWVPFLSLGNNDRLQIQYIIEIIQITSSIGCLVVWGSLCVAYLKFWNSQRQYDRELGDDLHYSRFRRESEENKAHAFLMSLQPAPAIIAVLGCVCIFAFGSATWWYSDITVGKFFIAYAAQVIVLVIFAALKITRLWQTGSFWAMKHHGFTGFSENLDDLNRLIRDDSIEPTAETDSAESMSQSRNESSESNVMITNHDNQRAQRLEGKSFTNA